MACLDMYSSSSSSASNNQTSDHNKSLPCSSPRISFSNDFAESNHQHHHQHQHQHHHHKPRSDHPPPPPSTDFEFSSVSNHSMMSADELFSKGRLLPFKKPTTLREELLTGDDEDEEEDGGFSLRPPKGSGSGSMRWKEILGLKKSHNVGSRKTGKGDGCGERRPGMGRDPEVHLTKSSQELLNDGRSSSRDVEFGM